MVRDLSTNTSKLSKIDRTILDNFYKLVHSEPNVRITAASSTYKILMAMQKNNKPEVFNEHLNYCVERLVAGLASSRALARQGYGTLLMEVLKKWSVSTERLLGLAEQKFGHISNETSKDNLLGHYLLLEIILESGNYKKTKQNSGQVEKMYKILMQLKNQKSYFDEPISRLLTKTTLIFYDFMLADIPPSAFGSDAKLTHTELLILALCHKHKPIRQLEDGLQDANIVQLSQALLNDRLLRKPLHPVWFEWSRFVMNNKMHTFELYYATIIHKTFFKPNHNELASLGLQLIADLISVSDMIFFGQCMLDDYVLRMLISSLRSKRNSLHKASVEFFDTICKRFEQRCQDAVNGEAKQRFILKKITAQPPGSITFDDDTKSKTLQNLLNHCTPNVLKTYTDGLIARFDEKLKKPKEAQRILIACAKQMAYIVHRPAMADQDVVKDVVAKLSNFLLVNSFFTYVDPLVMDKSFWAQHHVMPAVEPLSKDVQLALKDAFHATMEQIVSCCDATTRLKIISNQIDIVNRLIRAEAAALPKGLNNFAKKWTHYIKSVEKHYLLNAEACEDTLCPDGLRIVYPISQLYLIYGFQILEHGLECREQLDDLEQATVDALKNDPSDGSWADIVTDQIIAILSATDCKPWIRKLCVSIFGSLLPHITEVSIDLLCDVMRAPLVPEGEEDDEEGEDDQDDQDELMEESDLDDEPEAGTIGLTKEAVRKHVQERKREIIVIDGEEEKEEKKELDEYEDDEDEDDVDEDEEMELTDSSGLGLMDQMFGHPSKRKRSTNDKPIKRAANGVTAAAATATATTAATTTTTTTNGKSKQNGEEEESEEEEYLDDEQMMKLDSVIADMFRLNRVGKGKKRRDPSFKLRCLDLVKKVVTKKHNDSQVIDKILATLVPLATRSRKSAETRPIADKIEGMIAKIRNKKQIVQDGEDQSE